MKMGRHSFKKRISCALKSLEDLKHGLPQQDNVQLDMVKNTTPLSLSEMTSSRPSSSRDIIPAAIESPSHIALKTANHNFKKMSQNTRPRPKLSPSKYSASPIFSLSKRKSNSHPKMVPQSRTSKNLERNSSNNKLPLSDGKCNEIFNGSRNDVTPFCREKLNYRTISNNIDIVDLTPGERSVLDASILSMTTAWNRLTTADNFNHLKDFRPTNNFKTCTNTNTVIDPSTKSTAGCSKNIEKNNLTPLRVSNFSSVPQVNQSRFPVADDAENNHVSEVATRISGEIIRSELNEENDDDDDLPPTQPVRCQLLSSVIAYVEVRTGNDNRTWGIKHELRELGASVVERFNKNVTHVIFKEGSMATYKKAMKLRIPIVSVTWIEECKQAMTIVAENRFPATGLERYENPHLYPKLRKLKSMQPDFENKKLADYMRRRKKPPPPKNLEEDHKILDMLYPTRKPVQDDSPSFVRALKSVAIIEDGYEDYLNRSTSPTPSDIDEDPPPLAIRLLRDYLSPRHLNASCKEVKTNTSASCNLENGNAAKMSETEACQVQPSSPNREPEPNKTDQPSSVSNHNIFKTPVANHHQSLRHQLLSAQTQTKLTIDHSIIPNKTSSTLCGESTPMPSKTLMKSSLRKRRLLNPMSDDDPLVILTPPPEDASPVKPSFPYGTQKAIKAVRKSQRFSSAMELTPCVPSSNVIVVNKTRRSKVIPSTCPVSRTKDSSDVESTIASNYSGVNPRRSTRRSSMFLVKPGGHASFRNDAIIKTRQPPTIVCTSLHRDDQTMVSVVVNTLGDFEIEEKVSIRTSHVVTSLPIRRTLNLLKGISRGCWIVKFDWVEKCLQAGKWIDEERYEFTEFSPLVLQHRLERLSFGAAFKPDLFLNCGPVYFNKDTSPPSKDLMEVFTLCGGRTVTSAQRAQLIVGKNVKLDSKTYVSESWVLDCMTKGRALEVSDYVVTSIPSTC